MKKLSILAIAVAAVCGVASAHAPKTKAPTTIACAVMSSRTVNIAFATKHHMYSDYKGHRYFFCCSGCPASFKANPAKYVKSANIVTPKVTKK